jgi:hypothetical protein
MNLILAPIGQAFGDNLERGTVSTSQELIERLSDEGTELSACNDVVDTEESDGSWIDISNEEPKDSSAGKAPHDDCILEAIEEAKDIPVAG